MKPICREALPLLRRSFQTVCIRSITHNRSPLNAILKIVYPFLARLRIEPEGKDEANHQSERENESKHVDGITHRLVGNANNYIKQHIFYFIFNSTLYLLERLILSLVRRLADRHASYNSSTEGF